MWKSKFYGTFVLNLRVVLHAIDAPPARWHRHPTHWLISTQVLTLKQPSASTKAAAADTGEVEGALAAGGFRDLRTAWLWANGRKERTLAATYT